MPSCDHIRNTPRTSTAENADLAALVPEPVDTEALRERMQGLLDYLLGYYELHPAEGEEEV